MPDRQVTTGDTWESIAQKYGVTVAQLKAGNPGVSILSPGLIIRVPNYYAQPSQPTNPPYLAGGQWNAWEALATKPFTNRKDILEQNAFMRQGLGYQSAKTAVTDSQRYQAQYDAWRAAVGGVDMADFKKQEYGTAKILPKQTTGTYQGDKSMQRLTNEAQRQANYNAMYGGGPAALSEGGQTVFVNNQPYTTYSGLTNTAVNQYTGGTVSTKPQQNQQNKQNRYKLGANYVIYDPNGKVIYSAEQAASDRYNANHPKPPEPVDPTKYFGSVGTYTWKF